MRQLFSDLAQFVFQVLGYWQGLVTGGIIVAILEVLERLTGVQILSRRTYAILVLAIFLLMAFFLAWREEHRQLISERASNRPIFVPSIHLSMVFETKEGVHLFSIVGVKNTGVPSIVERVRLRIIGDKTLSDISPHEIEEGLTYYSPDGKPFIKFDPKDSLYEKLTSVPIERGGARQGWLRFPLSKAHVKDLLGKEFEISLKDITGKDYSVKATIEMQKPDEPVFGVPGIRNPFVKNP